MTNNILMLAMAVMMGSSAFAGNFFCTVGGQQFYATPDNLGYAVAFHVDINSGSNQLSIYQTPGQDYFNVEGNLGGVNVSTSVAFTVEYPQQNVKMGSLGVNNTNLNCSLMQ